MEASLIINVVKNLTGASILTLPSAVASFSSAELVLFPSTFIVCLSGFLSAYTFARLGSLSIRLGAFTYQGLWKATVSRNHPLVGALLILKLFLTNMIHTIVVWDTSATLLSPILGLRDVYTDILISILILYPLCLLEDLRNLSKVSFLGVLTCIYAVYVCVHHYLDGSYQSSQEVEFYVRSPHRLVSISSSLFIAHYNAPKFSQGVSEHPQQFRRATYVAFLVVIILNLLVMASGFLTFRDRTTSMILNNYRLDDRLVIWARFCLAVSVITGYPLGFMSLRDSMTDFVMPYFNLRPYYSLLTAALLGSIVVSCLIFEDLALVCSASGAIIAPLLAYILPILMDINHSGSSWLSILCLVLGNLLIFSGLQALLSLKAAIGIQSLVTLYCVKEYKENKQKVDTQILV